MTDKIKPVQDRDEQKRLRALSEEIAALFRKHDVCAFLLLHGRHSCDYRIHVDASWSCLSFRPHPNGEGKMACFDAEMKSGGDRARATMGMLMSMAEQFHDQREVMERLLELAAAHFKSVHHVSVRNPEPRPNSEQGESQNE